MWCNMENWLVIWISFGTMSLWETTDAGGYIPKREYTFYIGNDLKSNDDIGVIHVIQNRYLKCGSGDVEIAMTPINDIFVVLEQSKIFIRVLPGVSSFTFKETSKFELSLKCPSLTPMSTYYESLLHTKVVLVNDSFINTKSYRVSGVDTNADTIKNSVIQCLASADLVYNIMENTEPGVIDVFSDQRLRGLEQVGGVILASEPDKYLSLNASLRELRLIISPDRELEDKLTLSISCNVSTSGQANVISVVRNVTVTVFDVDDNPPYTEYARTVQYSNNSSISSVMELITFDYDDESLTTPNTYRVSTNDTLDIVSVNTSIFQHIRFGSFIGTRVKTVVNVVLHNLTEPYTVDVSVEDMFYEPTDPTTKFSNKAVHRIVIPANLSQMALMKEPKTMELSLDSAAAKYSLVAQLEEMSSTTIASGVKYVITGLAPPSMNKVLSVTSMGDVYVSDTVKLSSYQEHKPITVNLIRTDSTLTSNKYHLVINVNNNHRAPRPGKCDLGCSIHNTSESCTASCGLGAPNGLCSWRSGDISMSANYSTCSPNLNTCPDGVCSELESLHFLNCPQDCSNGTMTGQFSRNRNGQGIYKAKGTCWCESERTNGITFCNCLPPKDIFRNESKPAGRTFDPNRPGKAETFVINDGENETCSSSCKAAITGSLTAVVVVAVLVGLGWIVWRRRKRRQAATLKHVSSLVSMNAVPSDYIVDDSRDLRGHVNRQTASPASSRWLGKVGMSYDVQVDDRWEFPRQYLTLEHAIGEGEFGQVVRAQAFMLRGQEGNTVVAVKMLKPDASGSEYQDLVSEIQLLKEVSHPNVIQLLGVCTQKGPLYVIVEYCELGSLRNFLRSSKFKNKGNWDSRMKNGHDAEGTLVSLKESRNLTCRDLFSFAWQIAKGMDYLAGLKIVHRDLAARNVLVTEGLKLKISDFGLSRDVYEADTYMKMSKTDRTQEPSGFRSYSVGEFLVFQDDGGKSLPWMLSKDIPLAEYLSNGWPQSPYMPRSIQQKVTWASPYPGIPPERLFPLLSTGYRMDRPDDCPEELYAIMQKCWKAEPENRPPFSTLRDILDNLLQQNTEYLDLSDDSYMLHRISSGTDDKLSDLNPTTQGTAKPLYSNICTANHCQPNVYVATNCDDSDNDLVSDECPEMSKLLGTREDVPPHIGTVKPSDIILDKAINDGRKKFNRVLVHENLTYV